MLHNDTEDSRATDNRATVMLQHLACIMDGNRRWAAARGLMPWEGHSFGIAPVRKTIDFCLEHAVAHLSLYMFATQNFKRSQLELAQLFGLCNEKNIDDLLGIAHDHNVRFCFVGDRSLFPLSLQPLIDRLEQETQYKSALRVHLLFCYSGRQEIIAAVRNIARDVQAGTLDPAQVDEALFHKTLWLKDAPHPELVIRTGGMKRLSDFLLYQVAYSELYFTDCLWPDFDESILSDAFSYFNQCRRNFGL
jgi:undecaprenyl diphosphate synthase